MEYILLRTHDDTANRTGTDCVGHGVANTTRGRVDLDNHRLSATIRSTGPLDDERVCRHADWHLVAPLDLSLVV